MAAPRLNLMARRPVAAVERQLMPPADLHAGPEQDLPAYTPMLHPAPVHVLPLGVICAPHLGSSSTRVSWSLHSASDSM